jgi:hypothetical protein
MPLIAAVLGLVSADERPGPVMRTESFDRDPGWDAQNNRIVPAKYPTIVQDFGFSRTSFASSEKERPPVAAGHFLGVHVGGPTRVGHYFQPAFVTATGTRGLADGGPVLRPGKVYEWSLVYDPAAKGGQGAIRVTLGDESVTLVLKKGIKAQGARFDRFGVFTSTIGGQVVRIFLDELNYTATPP